MLLAAILILTTAADTGSSSRASWILERDNPKEGEIVDVWLSLTPKDGKPASVSISLESPADIELWFPPTPRACGRLGAARLTQWSGNVSGDTLLRACARASASYALPLVAFGELTDPGGARERFVATAKITPTHITVPAWLVTGLVTGLIGLGAGLVSYWTQKRIDREQNRLNQQMEAQKKRDELVRKIAGELSTEIVHNYHAIQAYVQDPTIVPPDLHTAAHNLVLSRDGFLAFIDDPQERNYYLGPLNRLYRLIADYNRAHWGKDKTKTEAAGRALWQVMGEWTANPDGSYTPPNIIAAAGAKP
ncbi:MAG: hypothetical protein HY700_11230 [Gemmatimonadetes bacterium]|nr:hypothetical protein [Gemmatimonadota bacterium]